jgi:hypothetical protein
MSEGSKTRVLTRQASSGIPASGVPFEGETFSTVLSTGRTVTIREMAAKDLLFMEKTLGKLGDMERGMKMVERLSVGENGITFPEIAALSLKDFRKVSSLLNDAGGLDDEDEDFEEEDYTGE